jgi:hypothetical protein
MFGVYLTNRLTNQTEKVEGGFKTITEAQAKIRAMSLTTGANYDIFVDEDLPAATFKEPKAAEANQ